MPAYTLKDTNTEEQWDVVCTWDELQEVLKEMPHVKQMLSTPKIVTGVGGLYSRVPNGFKDVLHRVKSGSAKSNSINI
jgi:hypothetical protein